jgi:hypothetical protein
MHISRELTTGRIAAAFGVAVAADLIQLPLTVAFAAALASVVGIGATVAIQTVDVVADLLAACVTTALLGFHWALLPTVFLEAIPGLSAAPTWTGCVAFVVWRRTRETRRARSKRFLNTQVKRA